MKPKYFSDQLELRKWFEKNHDKEKELLVGYYKKDSGKPSVTWPESVDQALCFGWIDGIRKSLDEISYTIRFTPRKTTSTWSAININKVKELTKLGLVKDSGWEAFQKRKENKSRIYSFEQKVIKLDKNLERIFKKNKKAWNFFILQISSYQRTTTHWVMSAKQEATRSKRLSVLIDCSSNEEKIPPMRWGEKKIDTK